MNPQVTSGAPARRVTSRAERRVTYALKVLALITLSAIALSAALDFIGRVRSVAIILIGAIFFTYAIYPVVRRLNARLPLIWAIVIVYAAIGVLLAFAVAFIAPALVADVQQLVKAYPSIQRNVETTFTDPNAPLLSRLPTPLRDYVATLPSHVTKWVQQYAAEAAAGTLQFVLSFLSLFATLVVIPVISAYLMLEAEEIKRTFMAAVPPRARKKTLAIIADLDKVLGGFIRGQFLVGAIVGSCITVMLLLTRVKYAVLIGVAAGLLDIIPYVGAVAGFVPAVLLAFFNQGWQHAALVAVLFVLIFQLEGHFIAPNIVSGSVGLSPLMVIVAILVGADLHGLAGMFIAVPVAAILRVLVIHSLPVPVPVQQAKPALTATPRDELPGPDRPTKGVRA
jgi:predicted PurR-regulated permease PerM